MPSPTGDGLFYELGLRYPAFRVVADETLRDQGIRCKCNDWITVPFPEIPPNGYLVNDTCDRLSLHRLVTHGIPAVNPANNVEFAVVESVSRKALESVGLTVWNAMEYVALTSAAVLRRRSQCFLDCSVTADHLGSLEQAFPALVETVKERYTSVQITRVLRELLSEDISIRNLRMILEALLDFDVIEADTWNLIVFDDRLPVGTQ